MLAFLDHLPPFVLSVLRLSVWLGGICAIFLPLERLFAVRPANILRKEVAVDLAYYFINGVLPVIVLSIPLALVAHIGRQLIPLDVLSAIAAWPVWLKMLVAMLVGEFGFYWGHRWTHEWPVLWRFHAVHHSAEQVDFLTNTRAHPVDMVFVKLCGLAPLYMVGLANTAASLQNAAVLMAVSAFTVMWGFFIHANLRLRLGPLEHLISTPAFHRWHHTRLDHRDHNYASILPWIDRIFGTHYLPKGEWPAAYGITTPMPATLVGQLLHPWAADIDATEPDTGRPPGIP